MMEEMQRFIEQEVIDCVDSWSSLLTTFLESEDGKGNRA
jgi:hypothetical protein